MGPFDLDQQHKRMESIQRLLDTPGLTAQARDLWTHKLNNIALDEDTYNMRVMWTYRNHNQEIISYE